MGSNDNIKTKVISGLIWKFAERISAQTVTLVVSIVLARLLSPEHYGAIAIVNIFIAIANVFVDSGFGNSLIQKKDADDTDFSSVFYFNIMMSTGLYIVLFLFAPVIADFYNLRVLCTVLRVMGLRLIVAGVNSIQQAYVARHMLFRRFFWATLGGTVLSGIVGIVMAYRGFGVWALAGQYMTNTTISTIVLMFVIDWRPKLLFSLKRLGRLFSFGWKLLVSSLLETGYNQLRSLFIGKLYTKDELAHYDRGKQFPNLVVTNINTSIQSVLFPAMSDCQEQKERVKSMMRRSIRTSSYIMLPLMTGLALVAKPFISLLLTEKWLPCVPFLQIYCFTMGLMPMHTANLQAIKAMGRSDIFLKLEIIKKTFGIGMLLLTMHHGVLAIAFSGVATTLLATVVNSYPNKKLIGYSYFEQIKDLFNCLLPLFAMSGAVIAVSFIELSVLMSLALQVITGFAAYVLVSYLTKNETFGYIMSMLKGFLKKRG